MLSVLKKIYRFQETKWRIIGPICSPLNQQQIKVSTNFILQISLHLITKYYLCKKQKKNKIDNVICFKIKFRFQVTKWGIIGPIRTRLNRQQIKVSSNFALYISLHLNTKFYFLEKQTKPKPDYVNLITKKFSFLGHEMSDNPSHVYLSQSATNKCKY